MVQRWFSFASLDLNFALQVGCSLPGVDSFALHVFVKVMPSVAIAEVKELLPPPLKHKGEAAK